jgi:hypothetical protein
MLGMRQRPPAPPQSAGPGEEVSEAMIELQAKHSAEATRLLGQQQNARAQMQRRHREETAALLESEKKGPA